MKVKKYFIGTIEESCGGMEYADKFLFKTVSDPEKKMRRVTREWRGTDESDYDEDMGGYWSDDTLIKSGGFSEIPREHFDVLAQYLAVL